MMMSPASGLQQRRPYRCIEGHIVGDTPKQIPAPKACRGEALHLDAADGLAGWERRASIVVTLLAGDDVNLAAGLTMQPKPPTECLKAVTS
jgi:hypothetical protein